MSGIMSAAHSPFDSFVKSHAEHWFGAAVENGFAVLSKS